jgi:hypothetical protein
MEDTLGGEVQKLVSAWSDVAIITKEKLTPAIEGLINKGKEYAVTVSKWLEEGKLQLSNVLKLTIALGGLGGVLTAVGTAYQVFAFGMLGVSKSVGLLAKITFIKPAIQGITAVLNKKVWVDVGTKWLPKLVSGFGELGTVAGGLGNVLSISAGAITTIGASAVGTIAGIGDMIRYSLTGESMWDDTPMQNYFIKLFAKIQGLKLLLEKPIKSEYEKFVDARSTQRRSSADLQRAERSLSQAKKSSYVDLSLVKELEKKVFRLKKVAKQAELNASKAFKAMGATEAKQLVHDRAVKIDRNISTAGVIGSGEGLRSKAKFDAFIKKLPSNTAFARAIVAELKTLPNFQKAQSKIDTAIKRDREEAQRLSDLRARHFKEQALLEKNTASYNKAKKALDDFYVTLKKMENLGVSTVSYGQKKGGLVSEVRSAFAKLTKRQQTTEISMSKQRFVAGKGTLSFMSTPEWIKAMDRLRNTTAGSAVFDKYRKGEIVGTGVGSYKSRLDLARNEKRRLLEEQARLRTNLDNAQTDDAKNALLDKLDMLTAKIADYASINVSGIKQQNKENIATPQGIVTGTFSGKGASGLMGFVKLQKEGNEINKRGFSMVEQAIKSQNMVAKAG